MGILDSITKWLRAKSTVASANALSEESEDESLDPYNPFPEPIEIPLTDVIDLHTMPPRDVKLVVEEYLYQAHRAGFHSVRIIHGKGIGVQRKLVRSILARTAYVRDWSDAAPDIGGLGATIVMFLENSQSDS